MNTSPENIQSSKSASSGNKLERIIASRRYKYLYMIALLIYVLLCGYILVFSGSLFVESVVKGWYRASASEYDSQSFMLGYLYGFASLAGVIGSLLILSTQPRRFWKFKVLLIVPSVVWSTMLNIINCFWGFQYWTQWLFLFPIMLLCIFVLFGVVKKVNIPYLSPDRSEIITPE